MGQTHHSASIPRERNNTIMSTETINNDASTTATTKQTREIRELRLPIESVVIPISMVPKANGWFRQETGKRRQAYYAKYAESVQAEGGVPEKFDDWLKANLQGKDNPKGSVASARNEKIAILATYVQGGLDAFWDVIKEAQNKEWKTERTTSTRVSPAKSQAFAASKASFPFVIMLGQKQNSAISDVATTFIGTVPEDGRQHIFFPNCDLSSFIEEFKVFLSTNNMIGADDKLAFEQYGVSVIDYIESLYADTAAETPVHDEDEDENETPVLPSSDDDGEEAFN